MDRAHKPPELYHFSRHEIDDALFIMLSTDCFLSPKFWMSWGWGNSVPERPERCNTAPSTVGLTCAGTKNEVLTQNWVLYFCLQASTLGKKINKMSESVVDHQKRFQAAVNVIHKLPKKGTLISIIDWSVPDIISLIDIVDTWYRASKDSPYVWVAQTYLP